MEDSTRAQCHDHKYIQGAERGSDHNEEVAGRDHLGMVADKGQPTLLRIGCPNRAPALQVLSYRTRRYSNPEFQLELVSDAFLSPCRIVGGHLSDQLPQVLRQARSSAWISNAKTAGTLCDAKR
jgi:hypothetical protein